MRILPERRVRRIEALEAAVAANGIRKHDNPRRMFTLRGRDGIHRCVPVREVVDWAKTSHGGRQLQLDGTEERGCMRWGMCE